MRQKASGSPRIGEILRYRLPKGMRYSTLSERENFYSDEFRLDKASKWLSRRGGHSVFAVIIGRHTKIYPRKFAQSYSKSILIDDYSTLQEVRNLILEFTPEAVFTMTGTYTARAAEAQGRSWAKSWHLILTQRT